MSVNSVYYSNAATQPDVLTLDISKTFIIDIVDPCKNEYITFTNQVGHTIKSQNSVNAEWTTASLLQTITFRMNDPTQDVTFLDYSTSYTLDDSNCKREDI